MRTQFEYVREKVWRDALGALPLGTLAEMQVRLPGWPRLLAFHLFTAAAIRWSIEDGLSWWLDRWEDGRADGVDRAPTRVELLEHAAQAMRVALIYARDRRGSAFDFDTWKQLVEEALGWGRLPPHAIEDAQAEALKFRDALRNVRTRCEQLKTALDDACRIGFRHIPPTSDDGRELARLRLGSR